MRLCGLLVVCAAMAVVSSFDELDTLVDLSPVLAAKGPPVDLGEPLSKPHLFTAGTTGMDLGEIEELGHSTKHLSAQGLKHFKQVYVKLAKSMHNPRLRESAEIMEQMSLEALNQDRSGSSLVESDTEGKHDQGGMKLVYSRLRDLQADVTSAAQQDMAEVGGQKAECDSTINGASKMITDASSALRSNKQQITTDISTLSVNKGYRANSVTQDNELHAEFMTIFAERNKVTSEAEIRIDERNKALDVLVEAIFIVCRKFRRFRDTSQCVTVRSQPDVKEPAMNTLPDDSQETLQEDKEETAFYEEGKLDDWTEMQQADELLVDDPNPEGLPIDGDVNFAGRKTRKPTPEPTASPNATTNESSSEDAASDSNVTESSGEDAASDSNVTLAESNIASHLTDTADLSDTEVETLEYNTAEEQSLYQLNQLSDSASDLPSQASVPLAQLVVALKQKDKKEALNLVQVLIDVKDQIYQEQLKDKTELKTALDEFYRRSWELATAMQEQSDYQARLDEEETMRTTRIMDMMNDNEQQRTIIIEQRESMGTEQERCTALSESFGERKAVREEDMANINKLISLLRALYVKAYPVDCQKGLFPTEEGAEAPLCSGDTRGWCIYLSEDVENNEQRCSCWPGFYGASCENQMCPGAGQMMYRHDEGEVCSRAGQCNPMTGKCHVCDEGRYHGPKEACENIQCPASGENEDIHDDQCSGHGTCNTKQGTCECQDDYSGDGCFFKKCPGQNGILYPMESPNACNGHGACNFHSGECQCENPYYGSICDQKTCPATCMDRGSCDVSTGKCYCSSPYFGPQCEYAVCPADCTGQMNGWCDRHQGTCLCKYGAGGEACKNVQYCTAEDAHTPEANWYRLWDNPGWALCDAGQSMYALYRNECEALSCLESARCAGLCEQQMEGEDRLEIRHCYHSLGWYMGFDKQGWSMCETNYYVSGLYRTCDSLYCLQMAKCCSYKGARWASCEEVNWGVEFAEPGWKTIPERKWITGFWRGKGHQLKDMQKAQACMYARGF